MIKFPCTKNLNIKTCHQVEKHVLSLLCFVSHFTQKTCRFCIFQTVTIQRKFIQCHFSCCRYNGILAIYAVTQESGFLASAVACILCWIFMVATGLLIAEVNVITDYNVRTGFWGCLIGN
ncbi:hypothetical protein Patl1_30125 [Pistacia atlantica]|uniref:Uncharacterized protein n=1 Tax=Pistacia atlantica TaxID=434234 RepID=A0ACC1ADR1_9ROSI|nr:hypothetical protein Patl1_30125 [Pistacia atlantica]